MKFKSSGTPSKAQALLDLRGHFSTPTLSPTTLKLSCTSSATPPTPSSSPLSKGGIWDFGTLTEVVRLMGERMKGKGGSSSSSSSSPMMVKCKCEVPVIMFMSRSVNHPRRRFWRCPHWNVRKCQFCVLFWILLCLIGIVS